MFKPCSSIFVVNFKQILQNFCIVFIINFEQNSHTFLASCASCEQNSQIVLEPSLSTLNKFQTLFFLVKWIYFQTRKTYIQKHINY